MATKTRAPETGAERKQRLDAWMRDYRRRLNREVSNAAHQRRLAAIGEEAAQRRRNQERMCAQLVNGTRECWSSIGRSQQVLARHGRVSDERGAPLDLLQRWHRLRVEADGPLLEPYNRAFRDAAEALGVKLRWDVIPGVNAHALGDGSIECWPIRSEYAAGTAWHELGHTQNRCPALGKQAQPQPRHHRVPGGGCPRCELIAWRWAIHHAQPAFTPGMFDALRACLPTYRPDASIDEQREIDRVCSGLGLRAELLKRAVNS